MSDQTASSGPAPGPTFPAPAQPAAPAPAAPLAPTPEPSRLGDLVRVHGVAGIVIREVPRKYERDGVETTETWPVVALFAAELDPIDPEFLGAP